MIVSHSIASLFLVLLIFHRILLWLVILQLLWCNTHGHELALRLLAATFLASHSAWQKATSLIPIVL